MPSLTNDPQRLSNLKTVLANTYNNLINTATPKAVAAEVLLHTVLGHADQDPEQTTPSRSEPSIGYVILFKETTNGTTKYTLSGRFDHTYDNLWMAQRVVLDSQDDPANYVIAPIYPVNLTRLTK